MTILATNPSSHGYTLCVKFSTLSPLSLLFLSAFLFIDFILSHLFLVLGYHWERLEIVATM